MSKDNEVLETIEIKESDIVKVEHTTNLLTECNKQSIACKKEFEFVDNLKEELGEISPEELMEVLEKCISDQREFIDLALKISEIEISPILKSKDLTKLTQTDVNFVLEKEKELELLFKNYPNLENVALLEDAISRMSPDLDSRYGEKARGILKMIKIDLLKFN